MVELTQVDAHDSVKPLTHRLGDGPRPMGKLKATHLLLKQSDLFGELPSAALKKFAELATNRAVSRGEIVFQQGDPGDALFGVISGKVLISGRGRDGKEVSLNIMEPGALFGEIALFDGEPRTANATAAKNSVLLVIQRRHFKALLQREPALAIHLLQLLCKRIRWTSELVEESALLSVPTRLARRLAAIAELEGERGATGITVHISQNDLAQFIGVSRQVVNGYLQDWRREDWISLGRSRVVIEDMGAIQELGRG